MIARLVEPMPGETNSSSTGFTLLEVIIALAIMAIAFGAILAVQGSSIQASIRAKQMNTVAMLAKNQMVETEFKIRGKTFEEYRKEEEGKFEAPYSDYRWKVEVKEIKFPQVDAMSGGGGGASKEKSTGEGTGLGGQSDIAMMIGKLMTNFLSKALREVSVTVLWKTSGKDQSFSLTTYWVNLNHEFSLTE